MDDRAYKASTLAGTADPILCMVFMLFVEYVMVSLSRMLISINWHSLHYLSIPTLLSCLLLILIHRQSLLLCLDPSLQEGQMGVDTHSQDWPFHCVWNSDLRLHGRTRVYAQVLTHHSGVPRWTVCTSA